MKKDPKVIIIGLDAATWTLIRPWMAEGGMPNLAKLMKAGVSGTLQSVLPPITPPAWTSFMTGKNPGKHGVFHFIETAADSYAMNYANGGLPLFTSIWEIIKSPVFFFGKIKNTFTYFPLIFVGVYVLCLGI